MDLIGTFSNNKQLSLQTYSPSWDGSCRRSGSCTECPSFITTKSRYMLQSSNQSEPATLIAILPVHLQGADQFKCGNLLTGSFYRALAVMFTLKTLAPNPFNLRSLVLDTCSNSLKIDHDLYNVLTKGQLCNTITRFNGLINNSTVNGVVTDSSANVMAASRVLAPMKIPLVGVLSTSSELNDKFKYPYLARTLSPDYLETKAIADILKNRNWTYVSVVYSKEVYGVSGFDNFKKQAGENGICIARSVSVSTLNSHEEIKNLLLELRRQEGANVVVVIALSPRTILQVANDLDLLNKYLWIGTETWGTLLSVLDGIESNSLGAITVAVRNSMITRFNSYLKSLTYSFRDDVPDDWFEEFYQQIHKCKLANAQVVYTQYPPCNLSEQITDEKLEMSKYVIYTTIAATYAVASGLERARNRKCTTSVRFRDCFKDDSSKEHLFQMLLETRWSGWTDEPGFDLNFNSDRYWDVGYEVYNFVRANESYIYQKIGSVESMSEVILSLQTYKPDTFTSVCTVGKECKCEAVLTAQQTSAQTQTNYKKNAAELRNYYVYKTETLQNSTRVYKQHFTWSIWAIAVCVATCVGLFIVLFIFMFFLCCYPVLGGTTILGFMIIFGISGIYAINFAFFLHATDVICGVRRFLMGVVYSIVFAALLVKSIDNWCFNDTEYSVRKYSGITSPCFLFMIAVGIICIEIIIPTEWLTLVHPTASELSQNVLHDWWWCDPIDTYDYSLVLSMLFVMFLVLLTAIFSGMAWDSQSNYYESRWICVSCICTAGCFLVWMIVSTNAGPTYRDPAVALGNFFNATALLIFLPVRKLVLLFRFNTSKPEQEEIEDDTYAHMDQGLDMFSTFYPKEGYVDIVHPLELKPDADNGF